MRAALLLTSLAIFSSAGVHALPPILQHRQDNGASPSTTGGGGPNGGSGESGGNPSATPTATPTGTGGGGPGRGPGQPSNGSPGSTSRGGGGGGGGGGPSTGNPSPTTNAPGPATSTAVGGAPGGDNTTTTGIYTPPGPPGGIGTNSTPPQYVPMSDFDFQSINLALNQEWIELDLFHYGLARFSVEDFEAAGLDAEDRYLIQFMAEQEVGHARLLTNILGPRAAKQCQYQYPFNTVREFVDFCQKLTRFGESGVYGFLEHLNSRPAATLLLDSIATEARQQMIFRQFEGLFPMPVWFETGITQSMAWTLLAPYIVSCPAENPRIEWQNFPALNVTNNPDATPLWNTSIPGNDTTPAITHNRSEPLSYPGREVYLTWELPGKQVGYNNSYTTNTTAGDPRFVAWISQLNTTYTPLTNINGQSGQTTQPGDHVFADDPTSAPLVNGTMFVLITDQDLYVTPFNLSLLNPHVVAGPALYQSG